MLAETSLKKARKLELLKKFTVKNEPSKATTSENTTNIGNIKVAAVMRLTTKYENGRVPDTSIASICSLTCILPSSAPMLEPNLPAQINPVISGPSDLITACETKEGSHDSAPKDESDGRDCFVKTIPARNDVNVIKNKERLPIIKHWRRISFISNGGVKKCFMTLAINAYRSATRTKKFLNLMRLSIPTHWIYKYAIVIRSQFPVYKY